MSRRFFGLLGLYVGVRHLLPKQVLEADYRDPELLSMVTHNCIFYDRVEYWFDGSTSCWSYTSFYWRRIQLKKIKRDGTLELID